ncbi:MAG: hypothetical protein FJ038_03990 [Chloroflexi bacterium]|nr:hypothetical protein [Chloroflexota bacterium]
MPVASVLVAVAVTAWIVAAVAALRLIRYRLPGRGAGWYAVRGYAFFSAGNFTPEGRPAHRVFLLAAMVFALALVALFASSLANLR